MLFAGLAALLLLPTPALGNEARQLFDQARQRYADADFTGAIRLLNRARARTRDSTLMALVHLHLGINQHVLGKGKLARASFREALTRDPQVEVDPRRYKPDIVARFVDVRRRVAGRLVIAAGRPGVRVSLDGREVGNAPLGRFVMAGKHHVRVDARKGESGAGYRGFSREVWVGAGKEVKLYLNLAPAAVTRQPGREAPAPTKQTHGEAGGGRLWTWIAAGSAAALLGTAVGMGVWAQNLNDEWKQEKEKERQGDRIRWEELRTSGQNRQLTSNVLYGVGGALAAAAAVLFFVEPMLGGPESPRRARGPLPGVQLRAVVGPATGLLLGGEF